MDLLQREGRYPVPPQAPKTLGVEFSGVVQEIGEEGGDEIGEKGEEEKEEEGFKVGDEVFGLAYGGEFDAFLSVPGSGFLGD